jgi:hypothetical protein
MPTLLRDVGMAPKLVLTGANVIDAARRWYGLFSGKLALAARSPCTQASDAQRQSIGGRSSLSRKRRRNVDISS